MCEKKEEENENIGMVTPPPFRPSDEPLEGQEPTASPTLADRARSMGLDDGTAERLAQLAEGIAAADISDEMLSTLARGISHDEDVQTADAAGYLRGRNEKIEAVLHQPEPQDEDEAHATVTTPVFPRYCRRSIWD